jgi:hypothetical protein
MIPRLTVVLRHNTTMPGDAALARREWAALVGTSGSLLNQADLTALYPTIPSAILPKMSTAYDWVAETWSNVPLANAINLIRRSAFAQEVFLPEGAGVIAKLQKLAGSPVSVAGGFDPKLVVALAHYYVIETEAVLSPLIDNRRIATVVEALLEPYQRGRESTLSRRLRAAKKTTLSLSHDLHIYKAKFFPRMVRALINIYGFNAAIFDPFCGSGTALLEASLLGQDAIGVDIDPICAMMSRSKVGSFVGDRRKVRAALHTFRQHIVEGRKSPDFMFPPELERKILRRDRIDETTYFSSITAEANLLATAVRATRMSGPADDLIRTLASDAVTKKIRYRFVGVGNGRYTIEIVKQSLLGRLDEKVSRSLQLLDVFDSLETELGIVLGKVGVEQGDARDAASWPRVPLETFIITSPPYLPASSGREHYASSRALAFAVLGFAVGEDGYFDNAASAEPVPTFPINSEADRLISYLFSDKDADANPQKDAMRFERKAIPTAHYLADLGRFSEGLALTCASSRLALVVADRHTFYSHRRGEIEHVVDCANLYGELFARFGLSLAEEIEIQLLKSSASRAKPRAKDDYHETVLIFDIDDGAFSTAASAKNRGPLSQGFVSLPG